MLTPQTASTAGQSTMGEMTYLAPGAGTPRSYMPTPAHPQRREEGDYESFTVSVRDGRSAPTAPSLDREGFTLVPHRTAVLDFFQDAAVRGIYYPEVESLIKRETGATQVHIFDHTLRLEDPEQRELAGSRAPVRSVHNDYTERSGPQRVRDLLPETEARHWLAHRFAVINVWRSISPYPLQTTPLAFVDARTIAPEDFVPTDLVYPDRVGEIYKVRYNTGHEWVYFPEMAANEAILLKCYDSARDGRARFTAHSAFVDPRADADAPPRQSIEVRTLVSFAPPTN